MGDYCVIILAQLHHLLPFHYGMETLKSSSQVTLNGCRGTETYTVYRVVPISRKGADLFVYRLSRVKVMTSECTLLYECASFRWIHYFVHQLRAL